MFLWEDKPRKAATGWHAAACPPAASFERTQPGVPRGGWEGEAASVGTRAPPCRSSGQTPGGPAPAPGPPSPLPGDTGAAGSEGP